MRRRDAGGLTQTHPSHLTSIRQSGTRGEALLVTFFSGGFAVMLDFNGE